MTRVTTHGSAPQPKQSPGAFEKLQRAPAIDLRVVLMTVIDNELLVALEQDPEGSRLPRGLPAEGEPLDAAERRIIVTTTGSQQQYQEQLYTLSVTEPDTGWTIIVSYLALLCSFQRPTASPGAAWHSVAALPPLSEADRMVVEYAVLRLRAKLGYTTIAFHLLPPTFTLTELQSAYETILDRRLDKRNFRRRMIASGMLEATNDKRRDGSHRPAALYMFRAEHDHAAYLTPSWADGN